MNKIKVREKTYYDYGFNLNESKALRSYIKSDNFFDEEALFEAASLSNPSISNKIYDSLLYGLSYEKMSKAEYIPISKPDFYGYQRKCLAIFRDYLILNNKWNF